MAPLPVEQAEESSIAESQRSLPTPFLTKTYQLVEDASVDDMVSWNDDGSTFIVWKPAEFARDLLPKYFKHNNFSSFVRQLNTYGFRKVVPDRWEFANDCFKRGEKRLLRDIHRRKLAQATAAPTPTPAPAPAPEVAVAPSPSYSAEEQVFSSNSSPAVTGAGSASVRLTNCTTTPDLLEENQRLRNENTSLNNQLNNFKGLCNNIFSMLSNHSSGSSADSVPVEKPVELLRVAELMANMAERPAVEEYLSPRLFGVSIGAKRMRADDEEEEEGHDLVQFNDSEHASDIQSEPLDVDSDHQEDKRWLELSKGPK